MTESATAKSHEKMIFMPLIEWVCVAWIPTMICTRIVGFPICPQLCSLPLHGYSTQENNSMDNRTIPCSSLQWLTPLLVLTSVLTLATITIYGNDDFDTFFTEAEGDKQINKCVQSDVCSKHQGNAPKVAAQVNKPRDVGIVMGSHLIPLLYVSIRMFICNTKCSGVGRSCEVSPDRSTCLLREMHQYYEDTGFLYVKLASLGGLAFAASNLYVRFQHRKFNSKRVQNRVCGSSAIHPSYHEANRCESTYNEEHLKLSPMRVLLHLYLSFLMVDLLVSKLFPTQQQQNSTTSVSLMIGIIHMFLISCHPGPSPVFKRPEYASWQNSFTPGEWMVVSTVVTTILSEFLVLHIFHLRPNDLPDHIVIAHAGLTGCIWGAAEVSFLWEAMKWRRQSLSFPAPLVIIIATTVGCLEVAMETISTAADSSLPAFSFVGMPSIKVWLPRSIHWLDHFLSKAPSIDGVYTIQNVPRRVMILLYWIASLTLCLPISIIVASWTTQSGKRGVECSPKAPLDSLGISSSDTAKRKRRVVLARKYFHLVAVILFPPITGLDRDMMSLSYAISIALLIILEMVRCSTSEKFCDNAHRHEEYDKPPLVSAGSSRGISALNQYYTVFFDEKDSFAQEGGFVVSHISLLIGCACPLWVHQLLQYSTTSENSFQSFWGNHFVHCEPSILLPFIGVITLGVGDSAGALGGLSFPSPTRWSSGSSRTLEGSFCMLLSMICVVGSFSYVVGLEPLQHLKRFVLTLTLLTLIEASTTQIDNLCLPIAGSTLLILIANLRNGTVI